MSGNEMWIDSLREFGSRLAKLVRRPQFETEMNEELQFHIEMQTERLARLGMSREEARRQTMIEFGGLEQTREQCREAVGVRVMHDFINDLRYAARTLVRSPGFTFVAVLTLALGIGANTAVFSVVNALLLAPLPFEDPDRIVMLWQQNTETGFDQTQVAWADYFDWKEKNTTFDSLGFVVNQTAASRNFMLRTGNDVTRIRGRHVTSSLFDVLGVHPQLGQTFGAEDDQPGGPRRVVLSHALWSQAFAADPGVIGRAIELGRDDASYIGVSSGQFSYEVIGVMPASFRFPQDAELWVSVAGWGDERRLRGTFTRRDQHGIWVVGQVKRGVTIDQARADLNTIQRQIADDPENRRMIRLASEVIVTPLLDQVNGQETRPALLLLQGAVAFVLLIACANVANLQLARAMSRRREMAIRVALGAGRLRVIRQLLTESLLLSLLGAGAGVLFAVWGIDLLELLHTDATYLGVKEFRFDRFESVEIDPTVLGFTIAVSVATGVLFGLIPAVHASRLNVNEALKQDSRGGTAGRKTRLLRNALLVSEVALALVLLAGASMALRGFARMLAVDTGMQPETTLRAELDIEMAGQVYGVDAQQTYDEVLSRLAAVPGVTSVSACGEVPLIKSGWNDTFKILGSPLHEALEQAELPSTDVRVMGPGAFKTLGIPLLEGRDFTDYDDNSVPKVTIINSALRDRFFSDESPLGQTIQMRGWNGHEKTIVGIVGSVRNYSEDSVGQPELYFPFKQSFMAGSEVGPVVLVRFQTDPQSLVAAIRHAVDGPDPRQQVLIRFAQMDDILDMSASSERFQTVLLGCFAGVALVLAMIGVYGVMAYSTSQRIREFGIRIALGARPSQILRSVVGHGALLCGIGIGIGVCVALALGHLLRSLIFGVESLDIVTLGGVSATLLFVGIAACLVPAWNAMRVNPMEALRHE